MQFSSSESNVTWFRDRYREGTLTLKPPYQRKPVWVARQKCYLIESILLDLPVPEIFIQRTVTTDGETKFAVVDGQQRVRTVLQFIGAETDPDEQEYNKFPLDKLPAESRWQSLTFAELDDEDRKQFYLYNFAVRYLDTENDEDVKDIFRRLNKFLTPLNSQELRNATYSGPFVDLVAKLADDDHWVESGIVTTSLIRRMNDIEFVSELVIGVLHGPQGGSARVIDEYYEQYEDYESEFPTQRAARKLFDQTRQTVEELLPNIRDTRWSNRTDFYTLFVAIASLLRARRLPRGKFSQLRKAMHRFADEVDLRLADERAKVSRTAVDYVRAVEKGANDKKRRADRHAALLKVVEPYFTSER